MERRNFLRQAAAAAFGAAAPGQERRPEEYAGAYFLPRRPYGREISIVGAGGNLWIGLTQTEADTLVDWSVDHGVNYFDVGPDYGDAEERLGPSLQGHRQGIFLASKTLKRDSEGAKSDLENSLRRLQTDYLDLYQIHGLTNMTELEQAMSAGGAMEAFLQARDRGQVRHLGFSAHSVPVARLALETGLFDSLLFPINAVCCLQGNFGFQVLSWALERRVTCIALKAMAWRPVPDGAPRIYPKCFYEPIDDPYLARLALSFALDLPIASLLPPGENDLFKLAVEIASDYRPLTEQERLELLGRVQESEPIFRL